MGYFQVRYDSRVVNYDRKVFLRLATDFLRKECLRHALGLVTYYDDRNALCWRLLLISLCPSNLTEIHELFC